MKITKKAQRAEQRTRQLQAQIDARFGDDAARVIAKTISERAQLDPIFAMLCDDDQHAVAVRQLARIHKLKRPAARANSVSVEELEEFLTAQMHRKKYLVIRVAPHTFAALRPHQNATTARIIALSTNNAQQIKFLGITRNVRGFNIEFVANRADIVALSL